ncbi:MAG: F-box-like domain-containing protein, partial [Kistimonas sp.]|nr:F-box-like domain-containing protein [Kistimonas sp.]
WHWHSARWSRITQFTREDARAPSPEARLLPPSDSHCLVSLWREGRLWVYGPDSKGTVSQKASIALGGPVWLVRATPDGLWLRICSRLYGCSRFVQVTTQAQGGTGRHSSVTGETLTTAGLTAEEQDEEQETEPAPHAPESRQDERQQRVSPASLAHAQHLPIEILDKILGYVPLSQHSNCALVCRRWYDSLPDTGLRLARWCNSLSADQKIRSRLLAAGYSRRARPFLQAARSPLLPVLDCQHQELLHQQAQLRQLASQPSDTSQQLQQQVDKSFRLLSALVHYSQHRQIIQPQQLGLAPAPFSDADTTFFRNLAFSPCGRWLAVICQPGNARASLILYGWSEGTWHRQPLVPGLKQSVSDVIFSRTDPDMLITTHSLKTCIWRREADTGTWRFQQGWKRSTFDHWRTHSMEGGDLVIVSTRRLESGGKMEALVQFYPYIDAEQGWGNTGSCTLSGNWLSTNAHTPVDQLALCASLSHADVIRNTVQIYSRRPDTSPPALWYCQESVLQERKVRAVQIQYSPANYSHLLVLMQNWQLVLLEQDAQHRLHELLTVNTCIAPQSQLDSAIDLESPLSGTRQLAVPYSPHKIQFWQEHADRVWQPGERIEASSEPGEYLCNVLFCDPGHTLVRQTSRCIDIWHRGACWQHLVRHEREETDAPSVPVLMSANGVLCVTTGDATGSLWLYAPDSRGVPTRKVSTHLGERIEALVFSNDGLSVVARSTTTDRALQLVPLPDGTHPEDAPQQP